MATIAAILLPNKGFSHDYLLLIPTAVVMATGLAQFSALALSTLLTSRLAAVKDGPARPLANTCWAALLALAPATSLLFGTGLQLNREFMASGHQSKSTLSADTRMVGLHVYGWNYRLFGLADSQSQCNRQLTNHPS